MMKYSGKKRSSRENLNRLVCALTLAAMLLGLGGCGDGGEDHVVPDEPIVASASSAPQEITELMVTTERFVPEGSENAEMQRLVVPTVGYEELKQGIEAVNAELSEYVLRMAEDSAAKVQCRAEVVRVDQEVISVLYTVRNSAGGKETLLTRNIATQSGEILDLTELVGEDRLLSLELALEYEIMGHESAARFPENSQYLALDMVWPDEESAWLLGEDKLTFVFGKGLLLPEEAVRVSVPFKDGRMTYPQIGFDEALQKLSGEWRLYGGEVDGYEWLAQDVGEESTITIYENGTADYIYMGEYGGEYGVMEQHTGMTMQLLGWEEFNGYPGEWRIKLDYEPTAEGVVGTQIVPMDDSLELWREIYYEGDETYHVMSILKYRR